MRPERLDETLVICNYDYSRSILDSILVTIVPERLVWQAAVNREFSFQADGPMDMRMDRRIQPTAAQVLNEASERELTDLMYEYGEERRSRAVTRAIVRGRPVTSTGQLARVVA